MFPWHLSIFLQITLRSNKYHICIWISYFFDLLNPRLYMCETSRISNGVSKNDSMCSLVERFGNVSESLLTGCIPNVERYLWSFKLNSLDFEVYSNSAQVLCLECVLAVTNQQTRLSYSTVSHNQILQSDILLTHYYSNNYLNSQIVIHPTHHFLNYSLSLFLIETII